MNPSFFIFLSFFHFFFFNIFSFFFHFSIFSCFFIFLFFLLIFHVSFMFFHVLSCSLSLLGAQNLIFFVGLNFVTISLDSSHVKNQFWGPSRVVGGNPFGPSFPFLPTFLLLCFVFFLAFYFFNFLFFFFLFISSFLIF